LEQGKKASHRTGKATEGSKEDLGGRERRKFEQKVAKEAKTGWVIGGTVDLGGRQRRKFEQKVAKEAKTGCLIGGGEDLERRLIP
jgi:hypothetical protein